MTGENRDSERKPARNSSQSNRSRGGRGGGRGGGGRPLLEWSKPRDTAFTTKAAPRVRRPTIRLPSRTDAIALPSRFRELHATCEQHVLQINSTGTRRGEERGGTQHTYEHAEKGVLGCQHPTRFRPGHHVEPDTSPPSPTRGSGLPRMTSWLCCRSRSEPSVLQH